MQIPPASFLSAKAFYKRETYKQIKYKHATTST